jgi:hypothetical protein
MHRQLLTKRLRLLSEADADLRESRRRRFDFDQAQPADNLTIQVDLRNAPSGERSSSSPAQRDALGLELSAGESSSDAGARSARSATDRALSRLVSLQGADRVPGAGGQALPPAERASLVDTQQRDLAARGRRDASVKDW